LPGRNPREAVDAFLEPLRDALSCIARVKITLSPGGYGLRGKTHALTVNDDKPIKLRYPPKTPVLMLRVCMQYEVVPNDQVGQESWRVSTRGYDYELQSSSGELIWSYHWHPGTRVQRPHIHVGRTQLAEDAVMSSKAHHPTDRVSLESIVRACITEYGAEPLKDDWDKTLALREGLFKLYRRWS
jgi:hypothetical protein